VILVTTAGKVGSATARLIGYGGDSPDPARRRPGCFHEQDLCIKTEPTSRKGT
jgi:hypothetical protein